ncbi:uncharacterized protein LOC131950211 [Physella acuta]|uniref:uncharacterized protein LOC131950211 n=1 Tax=Physella acuta TaxID=109671 RepID=UPI0027DBBA0B|nr:uncharacterized protein LOC131950211 [Physella acuta]XP_059168252.1 uncharacterized protein LOC131950211 [Physella acuta]XP_059168253.1 uncharacterized protein LOC131950211 [Physella acuta]
MVSAERIQVTLTGGAPWGFRLSGGGSLPLTINKIRKKSQAHVHGLLEGDAVISINGVHVHDKTQDEALELVEQAGDSLALEIFRGDMDELSREKPKKAILVPGGVMAAPQDSAPPTLQMTSSADFDSFDTAESELSLSNFKLITSVDDMSASTYSTEQTSGLTLSATVGDVSGTAYDTEQNSGLILTSTVDDMGGSTYSTEETSGVTLITTEDDIYSEAVQEVESSPLILIDAGDISTSQDTTQVDEVHSSFQQSKVCAEPFVDSVETASSPSRYSPHVIAEPAPILVQPEVTVISQPAPGLSPHSRSPVPPPVSPKPQRFSSPQPPPVSAKPPGVMSTSAHATFDDGRTRREVTSEQHVQKSDDGRSSTFVQRETVHTTSNYGPSYVQNQTSAFNVVQSNGATRRTTTSKTTVNTTAVTNKKGPTPFQSTVSSNIPLPQPALPTSLSSGNLTSTGPLFKPTKFVPGQGKKDIPGLYSPLVDGKENAPPQPMFQVKKIVPDKPQSNTRDVWRPNVWISDGYQDQAPMTPSEDNSPYSTLTYPKQQPGYSLVEEQKRRLLQSQTSTTSKNEYEDYYTDHVDQYDSQQGQHKHGRLHVFAPPVEIHADSGYQEYYDDMEDFDDGGSSPDSSVIRRRKKLYSDSAFYDAPGKNYPTITEQMKLCKKIAQSLTSAANRRARGAKMFMKRKRKSSKWIHEGHSEWSSSAGDVANLQELDSELSPDEGGNKPLLYFKIPSLKNRISSDAKQTKMALTQEQFEKLRLNSKKCEHTAVPPDTCFDIVADLKAHKGRGGRMFEKRKQRSDKFVIDETNAKFPHPKPSPFPAKPATKEKTPWQAAIENSGNVDAAFSQLTEWEKNQRLNQSAKLEGLNLAPLPVVKSTLKSDESVHLLEGKNFNRTAKGWRGGGEYPVAEKIHPVANPRQRQTPLQSPGSNIQQYNTKAKPWQGQPEPSYAANPVASAKPWQGQPEPSYAANPAPTAKPWQGQPEPSYAANPVASAKPWQGQPEPSYAANPAPTAKPWQGQPEPSYAANPVASAKPWQSQPEPSYAANPVASAKPWQSQPEPSYAANPAPTAKPWQGQPEPSYAAPPAPPMPYDQRTVGRQNTWQPTRQEESEWPASRQGQRVNGQVTGQQATRGRFENQGQRPKSWHPDSTQAQRYQESSHSQWYEDNTQAQSQRDDLDFSYAPVDYNFGSQEFRKAAYRQPIIPGTDL